MHESALSKHLAKIVDRDKGFDFDSWFQNTGLLGPMHSSLSREKAKQEMEEPRRIYTKDISLLTYDLYLIPSF